MSASFALDDDKVSACVLQPLSFAYMCDDVHAKQVYACACSSFRVVDESLLTLLNHVITKSVRVHATYCAQYMMCRST